MNVYDTAHNLANAIKESQEYKDYAALKEKIDANPELSGMMKDFESKQLDLQTRQMVGEEVTEDAQKTVQELYATRPSKIGLTKSGISSGLCCPSPSIVTTTS